MKFVKVLTIAALGLTFTTGAFAEIGRYSCEQQDNGDTHLRLSGLKKPQKVFKTSSEDSDGKTSQEKCKEALEKIKEAIAD